MSGWRDFSTKLSVTFDEIRYQLGQAKGLRSIETDRNVCNNITTVDPTMKDCPRDSINGY